MSRLPGPASQAAALSRRLEDLAVHGEWHQVAALIASRDAGLTSAPVEQDEQVLRQALASTERLLELARAAKNRCAVQLGELRCGRLADASYRNNR